MKIGFVLDDGLDTNDGVQQYVRTLGSWLMQQGHQVDYLVGESQKISPNVYSLSENFSVTFNGNRLTIPFYAPTRRIKELLKNEQYDLLHVQMPYSQVLAGKIIKHAPKQTTVVGTFHILPLGRLQTFANYILGALLKPSLRRFQSVCSVSPAAQAFAASAYGLGTTVIPNMINLTGWHTKVQPCPLKLVFLGRLVPRKGCRQLLQVLQALPDAERKSLQVIIAGAGPEQTNLKKFAARTDLDVTFLGYIEESEKPGLLASADYAVFPSLGGESFGIVLLEAMAAGAGVVIGGDNPGYRSVLQLFPETLIDFTDTQLAATKFAELLKDYRLRRRIHVKQQTAIQQYDINYVGQKIIELYQNAMQSNQSD